MEKNEVKKDEVVLEDFSEETSEITTPVSNEINLDELNDIPESERFFKITADMVVPGFMTIKDIRIGKPVRIDRDGKDLVETNAKGNKYYKGRLTVNFVETINGMKIRDFIPGLYFSVNKDTNELFPLPAIPRAGDVTDKFVSELSKLRTLFCNFKKLTPKDVSDKQFLKGLVGMKVTVEREVGKNPRTGLSYTKLKITGFTT